MSTNSRHSGGHVLRTLIAATTCAIIGATAGAANANAEDRLDRINERGELSVAVYRDFAPYSFADDKGRYTGIDVDIAEALAKQLGVRLVLRPVMAGEDSDDDLRNNIWRGPLIGGSVSDLMLHIGMDPEYVQRTEKAELFNAYQRETVAVVYNAQKLTALETPMALAGHRVAVENDSISDFYLSGAFNGRLRSSIVRKPSADEAVAAYLAGEVDAVMAPRGQLEGALFKAQQTASRVDITEFVGLFRTSWDVGMAIASGNPALKAALMDAMNGLQQSGQLDALYSRYGVTRAQPELMAKAGR
jgi:ABC-type amino acid transport substrate-binding protein